MAYCRKSCQSSRTNMLSFLCIIVLGVAGTLAEDGKRDDGGFQLFFGTQAPQLPNSGGVDINCVDRQSNCAAFGKASCVAPYDKWAKDNCANFCGFCQGPTTPAPACVDQIKNCEAYGQTVCNDQKYGTWAQENCRYYCRQCTVQQLQMADAMTTTIAPEQCVDKVDCRLYGKTSCTGNFKGWAKENCKNYCGFCTGVPTPPPACIDKINNCNQYESSACTDPNFHIWASDNCRKHCNLCSGGGGAVPVTPSLLNPLPATSGPVYAVPNLPGRRSVPALRSAKRQAGTGAEPNNLMTAKPPTTVTSTESPPSTKAPTTLEPPPALPSPENEGTGAEIVEPAFPVRPVRTTTEKGPAPPSTTSTESPPATSTEAPPDVTTDDSSLSTPSSTEMGPTSTEMAPSTDNTTIDNSTEATTESPSGPDNTTDSGPDMTTDSGVSPASNAPSAGTTDSGVPTPSNAPPAGTTDSGVPTPSNAPLAGSTDSGVPTPSNGPDMTTDSGVSPPSNAPPAGTTDSGVPTPSNAPLAGSTDSGVPTPSNGPDMTTDSGVSPPSNAPPAGTTDSGVPTPSNAPLAGSTDSGVPTPSNGPDMTTDSGVPTPSNAPPAGTTDSGVPTPSNGPDMTTDSGVPTPSNAPPAGTTDSGLPTPSNGPDMTTDSGVPTPSNAPPAGTTDSGVPTPSNGPDMTTDSGPVTGSTEQPGAGSTEVPATGSTENPATGTTEEPSTGSTSGPDTSVSPAGPITNAPSVTPAGPVTNAPSVTPAGPVTNVPSVTPAGPVTIAPSGTPSGPNTAGPTGTTPVSTGTTEVCEDKLPNCRQYGFDKVCVPGPYRPWAEVRCRKFCGFCGAPTTPPPCMDKLPNCAEYNKDLCENPVYKIFREDNCRAFCRLCDNPITAPTTPAPSTTPDPIMQSLITNCRNIRTDCDYFSDASCFDDYEGWARRNCALRCGYCPGKEETCVDTDPLCNEYGPDLCTASTYEGFARDKCKKFCNLCGAPVRPSSGPGSNSTGPGVTVPFAPSRPSNLAPTSGNLTASSQILSQTYEGPPSDKPGFCQYKDQYLNLTQTFTDGCDVRCTCLDNVLNTVVCTDICPRWTATPSECHFEKEQGACCDKLICNSGVLPGVPQLSPTSQP